ncbi:MAG: hypothetical protein Q6373_006865 [Candidatus Sigynarchaeota archaeon]
MAASRHIIEETIDAVLQQQILSSSFRVVDRLQRRALVVPGTKAAFTAIKSSILAAIPIELQKTDFTAIVDNLAHKFGIAKTIFDAKLASLPRDDPTVDARLRLVMLLSALREQWQNDAYETVLSEIGEIARNRGCDKASTSRDNLNKLLSSQFGSEFSHLVNLYVIREWGQLTGMAVKIRSARLSILNKLAAGVVKAIREGDASTRVSNRVLKATSPLPGPPRPGLPRSSTGLPPPPPGPPTLR